MGYGAQITGFTKKTPGPQPVYGKKAGGPPWGGPPPTVEEPPPPTVEEPPPPGTESPYPEGYNPFEPMNLYMPLSRHMDRATQDQIGQLEEQFGGMGGRFSTGLMSQMGDTNRQAAEDKQRLLSDLMYRGATDMYGRQRDSAQMQLELGGLQSGRDSDMLRELLGVGGVEQQYAQSTLDRAYQEWARTQGGYMDQIIGALGGGYNSQFSRDPTSAEEYGPWIQLAIQAAGIDW